MCVRYTIFSLFIHSSQESKKRSVDVYQVLKCIVLYCLQDTDNVCIIFNAPNFEKNLGAYYFWLVCPSIPLPHHLQKSLDRCIVGTHLKFHLLIPL